MERYLCPFLEVRTDQQNPKDKSFECKILGGGELLQEAGLPRTSSLCPFLETRQTAGNCLLKTELSDERQFELIKKYGADPIELIPQRSLRLDNPR